MPEITFALGVTSSPADWINLFNGLGSVPMTVFTPTQIVFTMGAGQPTFVVTGSGFAITTGGVITGGTIDTIEFRNFAATQVTFSALNLSASALQQAAFLDNSGADNAAVENLLLPLGWIFNGNANADILLSNALSSDGVPLNMSGKDQFRLNGGNDNVWMGDGNDRGLGGAGRDTIDGGAGADKLLGNTGNDNLTGGTGNDTLTGGTGQDIMTGNAGNDVFVFIVGDGSDRIDAFDLVRDRIDLAPGVGISFVNIGGDVAIDYGPGGDRVLLDGVAFADAGLIQFI